MTETKKSFGEILRELRKAADLTQEKLGEIICVHGSVISRFEKNRKEPSLQTLRKLTEVLEQYLPSEALNPLWDSASHSRWNNLEGVETDPVLLFVKGASESCTPREREILYSDIRTIVEIDRTHFLAKKLSSQNKWTLASKRFKELRKLFDLQSLQMRLRHNLDAGDCFLRDGLLGEALIRFGFAHITAMQLHDHRSEGIALIGMGDAHRSRGGGKGGDWEVAFEYYEGAENVFKELSSPTKEADCLRKKGCIQLYRGRPIEAAPLLEASLAICKNNDYKKGEYKAFQHMAWAYSILGDWYKAVSLCEDALGMAPEGDLWERTKALRYLGDAHRIAREDQKALDAYTEALEIIEKIEAEGKGASFVYGLVQLGLGRLYLRRKETKYVSQAKECFSNAQEKVYSRLGEGFRTAEYLGEAGRLMLAFGLFEEAETHLRLASKLFESLGNIFHYANAMAVLCSLYYERGQNGDFDRVYEAAKKVSDVDNELINYHLAKIEFIVGKVQIRQGGTLASANSFCSSSEKALGFNVGSFVENKDDLIGELEHIKLDVSPEVALQICDAYTNFWDKMEVGPEKQHAVKDALEQIRNKGEAIKALGQLENI